MRFSSGSKVMPFHTVPPVPVFQYSPPQVFAAISMAASPALSSGLPGVVWKRQTCLPGLLVIGGDIAARAESRRRCR
jgi:hypothetical protein